VSIAVRLFARGDATVEAFHRFVAGYAALHRHVASASPPVARSGSPSDRVAVVGPLHDAMRRRRQSAREGDLFTASVSALFRTRIESAIDLSGEHGITAFDESEDSDRATACQNPTVNEWPPWSAGPYMSPRILAVLPALPAPLEYRFLRRHLLLLDVDADLVVDILRNALPASTRLTAGVTETCPG
jgi:hypothetical protein